MILSITNVALLSMAVALKNLACQHYRRVRWQYDVFEGSEKGKEGNLRLFLLPAGCKYCFVPPPTSPIRACSVCSLDVVTATTRVFILSEGYCGCK